MLVMPSNNCKAIVHMWGGRYPGLVGHLYSPAGARGPWPWLPHALDNGVFGAWKKQTPWEPCAFRRLCEWAHAAAIPPRWVVVPDAVGDRTQTLALWATWAPMLRTKYGWPLALALQDGMTVADLRALDPLPDVLFVGGTTKWKWQTVGRLDRWRSVVSRMHVGRVNGARGLWRCVEVGVESCDGTGWFQGDPVQLAGLERFLRDYAAGARRDPGAPRSLFDAPHLAVAS